MDVKRLRRRFKKYFRSVKTRVNGVNQSAEKGLEYNVFRRFSRLGSVRRFIAGWILLMALLIGCLVAQFQHLGAYYQQVQPISGGIYSEGIVGSISNVNPVYATSDVDKSLSRLLFAGLLKEGPKSTLVGNLAASYETGDNGKLYTVILKKGLTWHDGKPLTSADVAFTYKTIKDADARSPLFASWQNIAIATPDKYTVTFTLPSALASFPYSLTTGIVPEHILGKISAANMRSTDFNTASPVGAGPFMWHGLQVNGNNPTNLEEQVALLPFAAYNGGTPKLGEFIMHSYASKERLQKAFESGQLTAAAGLDAVPAGAPAETQAHNLLVTAGTYVFFRTTNEILASIKVRQALVAASNPSNIIAGLGYMSRPVVGPLLSGQLAFNKSHAQKTNDLATAKRLLAEDGWLPGVNGVVTKNGKALSFSVVANDTPEYRKVTAALRKQWAAVGARVNIQLVSTADYANVLASHDYDATLYGISVGIDPDVYAYWDSSQADVRSTSRLNLSEWKNATADAALQAGRTRLDPQLRTIKYAPFLQAWQQESPALGLYQPRYLYLTRGPLYGLTNNPITSSRDRFNGVQYWQIRTARVSPQ